MTYLCDYLRVAREFQRCERCGRYLSYRGDPFIDDSIPVPSEAVRVSATDVPFHSTRSISASSSKCDIP